jgi:hypothetical protein
VPDRANSLLATRRGKLLLLLLSAVQFLDVVDSSIMNVALPSIRRDLHFSAQDLQWVLSGYLVTYGGLLLLGGPTGPAPWDTGAVPSGCRRYGHSPHVTGTCPWRACRRSGGGSLGCRSRR